MSRIQNLQQLFKRYRRPGDFVFATVFLLVAVFLLSQLGEQTVWKKRTNLVSQPAFWPIVSLSAMTLFAALNWVSAISSTKLPGRAKELFFWVKSLEYAAWFMVYVISVPVLGYLLATLAFAVLLTLRSGYRRPKVFGFAALAALCIVLLFKTFLQVKVPGGAIYEHLPDGPRAFMLTYF